MSLYLARKICHSLPRNLTLPFHSSSGFWPGIAAEGREGNEGEGMGGERRPHHIALSFSLSPFSAFPFLPFPRLVLIQRAKTVRHRLRKYFVSRASILIPATQPGWRIVDVAWVKLNFLMFF